MMSDNKKNPPSTDVRNPFGELIGLKFVKWSGGSSRCTLEVVENLRNPNGVVHGGVLYSMADTGMGAAIYHNLEQGQTCATLEIKIQYLKAVTIGTLVCETRVLYQGKRIAFVESEITNDDVMVAKASGSFLIIQARRNYNE